MEDRLADNYRTIEEQKAVPKPHPPVIPGRSNHSPVEVQIDPNKKRDDETMQEYSDRMDRLSDSKRKCECDHEKGLHMFGDCGICECERFVKKVYAPKEHLTQKPFAQNEALKNLRKGLKDDQPRRRDNKTSNPKSKRQR